MNIDMYCWDFIWNTNTMLFRSVKLKCICRLQSSFNFTLEKWPLLQPALCFTADNDTLSPSSSGMPLCYQLTPEVALDFYISVILTDGVQTTKIPSHSIFTSQFLNTGIRFCFDRYSTSWTENPDAIAEQADEHMQLFLCSEIINFGP